MMKCIHWYSTVAQLRWNLSLQGKSVVQLGMGRGSTWNKLMWTKLWLNLEQVNVDKVVAQTWNKLMWTKLWLNLEF